MTIKEIVDNAIKEAGIKKCNKRKKEAFLKQYYFGQCYELMTRQEVMNALKMDGVIA